MMIRIARPLVLRAAFVPRAALAPLLLAAFATGQQSATGQQPAPRPAVQDDGKTTTASTPALKLPPFTAAKQKFYKLIYGLGEVKPVVWMVVDGDDVYCDINRNGDLTEPGEKRSQAEKTVEWSHDGIFVSSWKTCLKSKYQGMLQGALFPTGGGTPDQAGVYHIAGPLQVLLGTVNSRLGQERDDVLFHTAIGTAYPGVVPTLVRYECYARDVVAKLKVHYDDGTSAEQTLDHRC